MNKHIIIYGDSKDMLPVIDLKVDAAIIDPPYNTANKNTKHLKGRKSLSSDFGEWDYFTEESYLIFIDSWISAVSNKIKENGNFLVFSKLEYISDVIKAYEKHGFKHHATIIWHKTNPSPQIRKTGFLSSCEAILWATKGFDNNKISYTFNFSTQKEMHNFIETPICMGRERTKHPTQKPKKVITHLLKIFTNENDTVLDCFAGSGTLTDACISMNRSSICIEKEKEYYDMMEQRISNLPKSLLDEREVLFIKNKKDLAKISKKNG